MTAPPMTAPTITGTTPLNKSFNISWITDPDYIYIVTWTNLCTGVVEGNRTVTGNFSSFRVAGLSGVDDYNVSVTANNSCGMMMSDPITVYGKKLYILYTADFSFTKCVCSCVHTYVCSVRNNVRTPDNFRRKPSFVRL